MKYCKETTKGHLVSRQNPTCIESLTTIIENEGGKGKAKLFLAEQVVLNLDKVVRCKKMATPISSMDITFGVEEGKKKKMVLVDFKFNQNSPYNFDKDTLEKKVSDSKDLLGAETEIKNEYYIIVPQGIKEQSRYYFDKIFRSNKGKPNFSPILIDELKDLFFQ